MSFLGQESLFGNVVFGFKLGGFLFVLDTVACGKVAPLFAKDLGNVGNTSIRLGFLDGWAAVFRVKEEGGWWAFWAGGGFLGG